jgi:hypothetical protein
MTQAVSLASMGSGPAFSANASSSLTLLSGTYTKVILDTEVFDTNSNFSSSRFTPTVAGYYIITANALLQSAASAVLAVIYKNGSSVGSASSYPASGQISAIAALSIVVYCNGSTDYIELYAYQGTASTQYLGTGVSVQMTGALVRGA